MNKIKLNVGGRLFETTKETLQNSEYFVSLLTRWNNDEEIKFIDRSGKVFEHVLLFLQEPSYNYPDKYLFELDFYGITYNTSSPDNLLSDKLDDLSKKIDNLSDKVDEKVSDLILRGKGWKECENCPKLVPSDDTQCDECRQSRRSSSCWDSDTLVNIEGLGWIPSKDVKIGHKVLTSDKYVEILDISKECVTKKKMVIINNILLTHGHPVYISKWYRAREIDEPKVYYDITLVNFTLMEEHTVILRSAVSELTVATLGKFPNNWHK
jgi:BTB/POZ domain/Hint-domain